MKTNKIQAKELDYEIVPLKLEHKFSGFSLGDAALTPLKTFAQKSATKFEQENLTRTYVALIEDIPKAYVSILCGEVSTDGDGEPLVGGEVNYRYKQYPAVKIARLAVDKSLQGKGIGRKLVDIALGVSLTYICPNIGCRFIMVDAKKISVNFYKNYGFTMLDTQENKERDAPIMYIDLKKLS